MESLAVGHTGPVALLGMALFGGGIATLVLMVRWARADRHAERTDEEPPSGARVRHAEVRRGGVYRGGVYRGGVYRGGVPRGGVPRAAVGDRARWLDLDVDTGQPVEPGRPWPAEALLARARRAATSAGHRMDGTPAEDARPST